ncbi:hypothetical protein LJC07_00840 [Christensenellaceae bacterium OttesenSCG-928-L17]|nr:hypothetical protein [Christensenellaceae bacterium OttesenSCG-928-L17]
MPTSPTNGNFLLLFCRAFLFLIRRKNAQRLPFAGLLKGVSLATGSFFTFPAPMPLPAFSSFDSAHFKKIKWRKEKMTKYTYQTVTGPVEIDIAPYWEAILKAEDAKEELNNRKHSRADHKYAPCAPLSLESLHYEGAWFEDHDNPIAAAELRMDLERALARLSDLQRRYFIMARIEGRSYVEIGEYEGKAPSTIQRLVESAERRIRNFF